MDLGGPRPKAMAPPRATLADATITTSVSRSSGGSLESTNAALRDAITRVTLVPTVEHHLAVSRAYRQNGIVDHALDYLNRSLEVNGPSAVVYDELARLWRDAGQAALGLADAHRAVYLAPKSAAYRNTLGTLLHRVGRTAEAEEQFRQVLALDPNAWYAVANLCHVNLAQGRTLAAIPLCKQATALRAKQPAPQPRQKNRP